MNTTRANDKALAQGTRVQGLYRTPEGEVKLYTATITRRMSVGWYLMVNDGETREVADSRSNFTVLPKTEYLSAEERAAVSTLKVTRKLAAIRECPERECRGGYTCAAHKEV